MLLSITLSATAATFGPPPPIAARAAPTCMAVCTAEAIGPGCLAELATRAHPRELAICADRREDRCRSLCDGVRLRPGKRHCEEPNQDDCDDRHEGGNTVVSTDIEACIDIGSGVD